MFGVCRQTYYRSFWLVRTHQEIASQVVDMVLGVRHRMPRVGGRKLYYLLQDDLSKLHVGRDKLFAILRANHLLIPRKRQYHKTTNSKHMFHKHSNLIVGIVPNRPEQICASDITYIQTQGKALYLSLVTDTYSKKILGYHLSKDLTAQGPIKALRMAVRHREYKQEQLIHHSDRGIQYCCPAYQRELKKHHITCSMTESYDPYANAVAERINGVLKQEFLRDSSCLEFKDMQRLVAQSIEVYNNVRPHLSCHMLTPQEMHQQRKIPIRTYSTLSKSIV